MADELQGPEDRATPPSPGRMFRLPSKRTTLIAAAAAVVVLVAVVVVLSLPGKRGSGTSTAVAPAKDTRSLIESYRGLGSWVDIFDARAWNDPAGTVDDMAAHGVRTLFIETGNSSSKAAFKDVPATEAFIRDAHAHGMRVVAWYLPYLKSESVDLTRITQAIAFRTSDGQAFDSFALDIESAAVKPLSKRVAALQSLSLKIRAAAGASYPLGAIIPSPVGLERKTGYWDTFPYAMLAQTYDVFLPMGYYTYHGKGGDAAFADATANVRIIRAQPGCADIPIHLIGGIAGKSNAGEAGGFVRAVGQTGCIGASLYGWTGTKAGMWTALAAIEP
jgi:hypothetical protein